MQTQETSSARQQKPAHLEQLPSHYWAWQDTGKLVPLGYHASIHQAFEVEPPNTHWVFSRPDLLRFRIELERELGLPRIGAMMSLLEQAAAPGGIGVHEFSREGGFRDQVRDVLGKTDERSEWTAEDSAAASAEGWDLFDAGEQPLQRIDETGVFIGDAGAWAHVWRRAAEGSGLHVKALQQLEKTALEEFLRIRAHCQAQAIPQYQGGLIANLVEARMPASIEEGVLTFETGRSIDLAGLVNTLQQIVQVPANGNSEPDVMALAIDHVVSRAEEALQKIRQAFA